ncbi:MAG: ergothioneine biosynthesis protein EgtB [Blastocatellia bacterium]
MPIAQTSKANSSAAAPTIELFRQVRQQTMQIVAPLEIEDYVIQTAEFMSPPRWHIGHTTWFFETLLQTYQPGYRVYDEDFLFYFNSYYEGFGKRILRARRGARSRPTVRDTVRYRQHIDSEMLKFLEQTHDAELLKLVRLGLEHEIQHQELLVYDIKHLLCDVYEAPVSVMPTAVEQVCGMAEIEGGLFQLGYAGDDFAWDNEKPQHTVFLQDFAIDRAPVSVGEYLEFIADGGYQDYRWWLSTGWEAVNREGWEAPLYWERDGDRKDGELLVRDYHGLLPASAKANEPVTHVSYFEAAAFAKWAGKRLPTEAEWEKAACFDPATKTKQDFPWGNAAPEVGRANLFDNQLWNVAPIGAYPNGKSFYGCHQMIGDAWEWTNSDYVPYPGFQTEFNEYNDKWFVGQKVLRGGSFATPGIHIRATYRNFFNPPERWMISGFRCAKTL